ncbi:hypothetical protein BH09DEP1_BH09DEP1_3860 [soil metagenome]
MKKLLLIVFAGITFTLPIQGMEKIKAWFGYKQAIVSDLDKCTICLEPLKLHPPVLRTVLACDHAYHHRCISQWLNLNNNCPLCRIKVNSEIKSLKKESPDDGEPDHDSYLISLPYFLLRVISRSSQTMPNFFSALPIALYINEKPTIKQVGFSAGLCGILSLISVLIRQDDDKKNKTWDAEFSGPIKFNTKNYALTNASIILNVYIMKGLVKNESLNWSEKIFLGTSCALIQHDAISHLMDREKK